MSDRYVVWFSAGAASAVAAKLTLAEQGHENVILAYTDPGNEHVDNARFIDDCEGWFDHPVERLRSERYSSAWEVWEKRRFLNSPKGALCTTEMKKMVRFGFELPTDRQVFGYTAEEGHRADRFREQNPGVDLLTPLIDRGLTKSDCLAMIDRAGIRLPAMYALGYRNNNCIGCVKGGMGYWNKIRRDFPEVFERMAKLERDIGATVLHDAGGRVYLDELDPTRGNHADEPNFECSLMCAVAETEIQIQAYERES